MNKDYAASFLVWEQLLAAIKFGDSATFMNLLDDPRLLPEEIHRVGTSSLLNEACKLPSPIIGLKLLALGVDPNAGAGYGLTPLHQACAWSNASLVEAMLNAGADIHAKDETGWTALHQSALANSAACIAVLLDRGADIEALDNQSWAPLHTAMFTGCMEAARLLIARGAKVCAQDEAGMTPAGRALASNQFDEALWLIAKGLKPSAADFEKDQAGRYLGLIPPEAAATGGHADILMDMVSDGRIDPTDTTMIKGLRNRASEAQKLDAVAAIDAAQAQACFFAIRTLGRSSKAATP